jgi:hypothetical protein
MQNLPDIGLIQTNQEWTCTWFTCAVWHSPTFFPQAQSTPFAKSSGLWDAQVPLNSPFFRNISLTDKPTKNKASIPTVNNIVIIKSIKYVTNIHNSLF